MNRCALTACFILATLQSLSQISGKVTDSKRHEGIPGVEVFIHGRTTSSQSNSSGEFYLGISDEGFVDLILYKKGYQLLRSSIRIAKDKAYVLNLELIPLATGKASKDQDIGPTNLVSKFKEALFGKEYMNEYSILNPIALSFTWEKSGLDLKAAEPLLIDNPGLGYQIRYYLQYGLLTEDQSELQGYFSFQPMIAERSKQILDWAAHRQQIYNGSLRHLIKSLIRGKAEQEGFILLDKNGKLDSKPVITPAIDNYYRLHLNDTIMVKYENGKDTLISQLIAKGPLQTNGEGILLIPENLDVRGSMAGNSRTILLPLDYEPLMPEPSQFMRYYERIYIQTDKPYYYPGEPLWFKGYIDYFFPAWQDSLSKVAYVEIIDTNRLILSTRILRIDSGFFYGDFILPDTLAEGEYFLRAYTNLTRNYGDQNLFMKPLPVIGLNDKADPGQTRLEKTTENGLSITADKSKYKTREKVTLTIRSTDNEGRPWASNISLTVTDMRQVVPIGEIITIQNGYPIDRTQSFPDISFKYQTEFGIGFMGRFLNDKGKPERTMLNILQLNPPNAMYTESNDEGIFRQTGLNFNDSATFLVKSQKTKDWVYGKTELLGREKPMIFLPHDYRPLDVIKTGMPQRSISEYEVPSGTRLLEEVTIKGPKIEQEVRPYRTYGDADATISEKNIKLGFPNLLYSLTGIPGLYVSPGAQEIRFVRAKYQSNFFGTGAGPLVVVNDVPMFGNSGQILSMIDPSTVESIQITKRLKPTYGAQGANGVIAVYTRQGITNTDLQLTPNFQRLLVRGYSTPRKFRAPEYSVPMNDTSKPDYRATIYWNPEIVTASAGTASVSFYTADLPGRYRIVAEGVTQNGLPLRIVYYIEVGSD